MQENVNTTRRSYKHYLQVHQHDPTNTLPVTDGTPRNCVLNSCGAQADTAIIRDTEMVGDGGSTKRGTALGKTQGHGVVDPANVISVFMGSKGASSLATNKGASGAVGTEDDLSGLNSMMAKRQRREEHKRQFGGDGSFWNLPIVGVLGAGGKKSTFDHETIVADTAGEGAGKGLPTVGDDGIVKMVYRQVNQDGAGPFTASIDSTSGGYEPDAFKDAAVMHNVPGVGISGLSIATNTDFPVQVQVPEGTVCQGKVGGAENVCIVRLRNGAFAGPFGGAAAFTQSPAARKRALDLRAKKRMVFDA